MQEALNKTGKIKLVIFTPTLQCGGSEKFVAMLCNNINKEKFDVTLVVLNNANPFYTITGNSVNVINLQAPRIRNSLFKIIAVIKKEKPSIVFTTANHLNIYVALFRQFFPEKIKFIARESSVVSINTKRAPHPGIYNWLLKKFYKRFNCIISQSEFMQKDLIENYHIKKEKTVVINNAVENAAQTQAKYLFTTAKFVTIARLSEEKGIKRLINAVVKLPFSFTYHIIGEGSEKESLRQLIKSLDAENKIFLEVQKDKPFAGMEDAHLFLMGSYYEGFPNTVLEAGSYGIPVIAYDVAGGINEIITDGENGFLVKENSDTAFCQAIEKAMHTNFNRQKIAATTVTSYSIKNSIEKLEYLLIHL